jgi:hypothetical protein
VIDRAALQRRVFTASSASLLLVHQLAQYLGAKITWKLSQPRGQRVNRTFRSRSSLRTVVASHDDGELARFASESENIGVSRLVRQGKPLEPRMCLESRPMPFVQYNFAR